MVEVLYLLAAQAIREFKQSKDQDFMSPYWKCDYGRIGANPMAPKQVLRVSARLHTMHVKWSQAAHKMAAWHRCPNGYPRSERQINQVSQ